MQRHDIYHPKVSPAIAGLNGSFYTQYLSSEAQVCTQSKQMLTSRIHTCFLDVR